jgi:hypothetical protein
MRSVGLAALDAYVILQPWVGGKYWISGGASLCPVDGGADAQLMRYP